MRQESTYDGEMMNNGKENENYVINWLRNSLRYDVRDTRDRVDGQYRDIDCMYMKDKKWIEVEIKSDRYIKPEGNLCFEYFRIYPFAEPENVFYLGWGWRSSAKQLIIRNPNMNDIWIFNLAELRKWVGKYMTVRNIDKFKLVATDTKKTTWNLLIPMREIDTRIYEYYTNNL